MTAAEIVKTPSSSNQNARKKKRKISKHVLQAQEDRLMKQQQPPPADGGQGVNIVPPPESLTTTDSKAKKASTATSASKKKKNKNVKDPNEVANYLTQWKRNNDGEESVWKFNKNTQSWLIRHMYEADKLSKASFTLLLGYLDGMKGGGDAKSRILTEASRRAVRYKEYEKVRDEKGESNAVEKDAGAAGETTTTTTTQPPLTEEEEEDARWNKLDDHDKRNEYKRARKILDALKESKAEEP
jgi:hypothetical protein